MRVRYAEVDAQAVVYNAHYLMYFDIALVELLRALDVPAPTEPNADGCDFVVKRAAVEYTAPLRLDELFDVGCRVARLGRSSVTFALGIFGHDEALARSEGEIVWVYTDMAQRRAVPIPDELRTLLLGVAEPEHEIARDPA